MQRTQIGMPFTMYGVFCLIVFSDVDCYEFYEYEAHFRTESIGASSMTIACNLGKLFAFFYQASQHECTIKCSPLWYRKKNAFSNIALNAFFSPPKCVSVAQ